MSESLPSTATSADEKEKASITSAHDTRQMGGDFSATIDFNKQNVPEAKAEASATPEKSAAEQSPALESDEAVVARLEREGVDAKDEQLKVLLQIKTLDDPATKSGKPLENSQFLDRAGLQEKAMSLAMLGSQKNLARAEASPEANSPKGQAEIALLKEERKKLIEMFKVQVEQQVSEMLERGLRTATKEDYDKVTDEKTVQVLMRGAERQIQLRADLEAAGMSSEEVKAVVAEAVVESPEEKQAATQGESMEFAIAQMQVEGPEKAAPTEKPDDNLRVALLNFAEVVATIAARSANPEEKRLFEAVLENIKKLSELGAAKVEKDAKISIREMLGVAAVSGGGQEVTSSALDKFTKGMEEDKKGKGGSFFKNLLGKIGQFSWVKKLKGLFGSAKSGLEGIPGITKLGLVGVKGRIEGLLAGQFGKLDLGKKLGAKKVSGAEGAPKRLDQAADENAKVFTAEENAEFRARIAAGEGAKAENAPLRARFDELNKTTQASEAPVRPTPKEVIDALEKQSGDETISLNEAETAELLARVNKMRETAAAEEAAKAGVASPETVQPPATAAEGRPEAVGVSADDLPEEITAELDPSTLKLAVQFNSETYAALKGLSKEAVTRLIDQSWEGIKSEKAELVKNRILYKTLLKEVQLPDDMRVFLLETLKKRGYADYEKKDEKYTFSRSKV